MTLNMHNIYKKQQVESREAVASEFEDSPMRTGGAAVRARRARL
jgi:hypothetical protein